MIRGFLRPFAIGFVIGIPFWLLVGAAFLSALAQESDDRAAREVMRRVAMDLKITECLIDRREANCVRVERGRRGQVVISVEQR